MKVNIFTAADSVNLYGGKLVIVGAFDNIKAEQCPFFFKPFGVALKAVADIRDYGREYDGLLILRRRVTKKALLEMPVKLVFAKRQRGRQVGAVMCASIFGIRFDSFGRYALEFIIGSKLICATSLDVIEVKLKSKKKKKKKKA